MEFVDELGFSFPFFSQAIARLTKSGAREEDAVPSQTEMRLDVSFHTEEVQDEEDGALLHSQACGRQFGTVLVPNAPGQSPNA